MKAALLACGFLLLVGNAAVAQSYDAPICEVSAHPASFVGQTIRVRTPIVIIPVDTVMHRSSIRVDAVTACQSDEYGLDLIFDEESDDRKTGALLKAIREMLPVDVNSRCPCTDCSKYNVTAELQVTVKKWQKEPPPMTKEGLVIDVGGEEPEYQLQVRKVLRYSAKRITALTCSE